MFLDSSPVAVEVASSFPAICLPAVVNDRAPRMPIAAMAMTTRDSPIQRATSELVATRARFRTLQAYPAMSTRSVFPGRWHTKGAQTSGNAPQRGPLGEL